MIPCQICPHFIGLFITGYRVARSRDELVPYILGLVCLVFGAIIATTGILVGIAAAIVIFGIPLVGMGLPQMLVWGILSGGIGVVAINIQLNSVAKGIVVPWVRMVTPVVLSDTATRSYVIECAFTMFTGIAICIVLVTYSLIFLVVFV